MDSRPVPVVVLTRALDQAGDALDLVHAADLERPTPCADWSVRDLVGHLTAAPGRFLAAARGEEVDWGASVDPGPHGWSERFREDADDLVHHWHGRTDEEAGTADWQSAELAVHTWDLLRALGRSLPLDDEVATRGLAFVQQGLTPENRGAAFGPAVDVGPEATPYERLVAFTGRDPSA